MKPALLLIVQIGFILLTIIYFVLFVKEIQKGIQKTSWDTDRKKKVLVFILRGLALWGIFVTLWSGSEMMADFSNFPFNMMPVIAVPLITAVSLMFSKNVSEILFQIPVEKLILLQSFRFFVELLLWALFIAEVVPVQMTFEGKNFDILAGITAPVIAWLVLQNKISKTALIIWHFICLGLLINIVSIAILSTPSPWRMFMNEPSNTIVTHFPVSFLPGFLVPLAYTLHFFSLKQLFSKRVEQTHFYQ